MSDHHGSLTRTVAGVQCNVVFADPAANLATMQDWLDDSRLADADLVVFPECMLTGYCFRSLEEARPVAQAADGKAATVIAQHCRETGRFVAYGFLEADSEHIYNAVAIVGPEGLAGLYRKIHLPHLGIDRFVRRGEDPFRVYDCGGMQVGPHICYDGSFPESCRILALAGADLLILPTNWPPGADTFAQFLPNARALENHVYYMSVNRIGTERGFRFIGQSRLCGTDGRPIAGLDHAEVGFIKGRIDLSIARNKHIVRVPGEHMIDRFEDRRPEFYSPLLERGVTAAGIDGRTGTPL